MNTLNKSAVKQYQDFIALISLVGAIALLCWKAPYGFGFWDESWYLTFAHRFFMGDSMVADEWNIIQLFSFFLYLPVKIYLLVFGSTEGIILSFRYLFIIFQSSISVAIYLLLRKYGVISIFALIFFCLYVPATVMAVCYYSLVTGLSALLGLLLAVDNIKKLNLLIIGIIFACIVLANPFLALIYFIYLLFLVIFKIHRKKSNHSQKFYERYFLIKSWFWITLGIAIVALIFLIFLLSRTTIHEIIVNLPHVLDDPEYNIFDTNGKKQNIIIIKQSILEIININPCLLTAYALLVSAIAFDKNRISHRLHYLISASVIVIVFIVFLLCSSNFYKYFLCMLPLTLLGFVCYILSKNKDKNIFYFVWVWGIIVAFFEDIASNQGTKLMSLGLATSVLASIVFIINLIDEVSQNFKSNPYKHKVTKFGGLEKKVAAYFLVTVLLSQIGFQCYILTNLKTVCAEYFYHDQLNIAAVNEKLDIVIQNGPAKGLITTKNTANIYDNMLSDLLHIKYDKKGPVLILGLFPWAYLYVGNTYATYTTKFLIENWPQTKVKLSEYYRLHPEKKPAYIYVPKKISLFISENDPYNDYADKMINEVISDLKKEFNCKVSEGNAGYTVKILHSAVLA